MADISSELNSIKHAIYGGEVRDSIHDAIEKINDDVDGFVRGELDTTLTSTVLPAQGKAVGDAVNELKSHLDMANRLAENVMSEETITYTTGQYLDVNGERATSSPWRITNAIPVTQNGVYEYSGLANTSENCYAAFFTGTTFNSVMPNSAFHAAIGNNALIVPQGANYVRFSVKRDDQDQFSFKSYVNAIRQDTDLLIADMAEVKPNSFSLNNVLTDPTNMIWSWWYYPQVISFQRVRNKMYWGYTTNDGYTGIAEYDFDTHAVKKNNLKKSDVDDHNGLALHIFDDGTILCAYSGGHNTDQKMHIRISSTPESIERFEPEIELPCGGLTSYGQLVYYDSKLYLFYRVGNTSWRYRYSDDYGLTWTDEVTLITATIQYYCKFMPTTQSGIIRMCMYSNPGADDSNIRLGFLHLANGEVYDKDNTTLLGTSSITYTNFGIIIPNETDKTQRLFDVALTSPERTLILYAPFSTNSDSVYKIYDDGNTVTICEGGTALWNPKYQLGASFIDTSKIVLGRGYNSKDWIETYTYDGTSTALSESIHNEGRGEIPIRNARPIVDINGRAFLWHRGYYNSGNYTKFNADAKIHLLT